MSGEDIEEIILNYKRGQIEGPITGRLPRAADRAFDRYSAMVRKDAVKAVKALKHRLTAGWCFSNN
ncbi:MAG: hypothetical protein N3E40_02245 [Dehalococcoidia bacterium]|nr:hypothetical protein [Dehalococcoidia bacterium]